jgi:hypothetical protein
MAELLFTGKVDGLGKLHLDDRRTWDSELALLAGKLVVLSVKVVQDTRSLAQNRRMWAVYGDAVAESVDFVELATGQQVFQTRADVHGFAKLALLRRPVITNRGEIDLLGTTTTLTTAEHSTYMEMLFAKLAKYGVYIPEHGR